MLRLVATIENGGIRFVRDVNAATGERIGYSPSITRRGRRVSAATAVMRPAGRRRNVTVVTRAEVERVTFEGIRATGVAAFHREGEIVMSISGKVVLITGASSGIGAATARVLAPTGARLMLGARRTDRLEALVDEIAADRGTTLARRLDVTSRESVDEFVQVAMERFGRVDVLVNNAGIMPLSPVAELRVDEWDAMIDVNLRGVLHGIAAVLPIMNRQAAGQIITVSSVGGLTVQPTGAVYSATKFAVRGLCEGLRKENPILRISCVYPGVVESELAHTISDPEARARMIEYRRDAIPAEAIGRAIRFAIEQPPDVDVNEIVVRPTLTQV